MLEHRKHKQAIFHAQINDPIVDAEKIDKWIKELVEKIDMKILMGPFSVYSDLPGNEGITSIAAIETSHIALHIWDRCEPALMELDIFSCKDFDINIVLNHMKYFGLEGMSLQIIDRTNSITEEKFWCVYKTKNIINNKVYVGVHGTKKVSDDYLGSGSTLKKSIEKYGRENFRKSIISVHNTKEEAYKQESIIVDYEFINDPRTYNLKEGGFGWTKLSDESIEKLRQSSIKNSAASKMCWVTNGIENFYIFKDDIDNFNLINPGFNKGRVISEKTKQNMSKTRKGRPSHKKGKKSSAESILKIKNSMLEKFKNGYTVHNAGKKLINIDGKKIWVDREHGLTIKDEGVILN